MARELTSLRSRVKSEGDASCNTQTIKPLCTGDKMRVHFAQVSLLSESYWGYYSY
jgi:hypothetical protein